MAEYIDIAGKYILMHVVGYPNEVRYTSNYE
jgi:hypothetical protein